MKKNNILRLIMLVGDKTISYTDGSINYETMHNISLVLSDIKNSGIQLSLVSAGAILMGTQILKLHERAETLSQKQAIAAVGQVELIKSYQDIFNNYGQQVAQVLLTRKMMMQEKYRNNLKATMNELLSMGVLPIINENDSVSTDDIELEDSYPLAAKLAEIINANILVIASDIKNKYHILLRNSNITYTANNQEQLYDYIEKYASQDTHRKNFPKSRHDLVLNENK